MITEKKKYDKVLEILKKSKPVFNDPETLADNVIRQIRSEKTENGFSQLIMEFFFGWVYIGWMRRSLVAAAMVLILFFGYEQIIILQRINALSEQRIRDEVFTTTSLSPNTFDRNLLNFLKQEKFRDSGITFTEKEVDKMIRSVNKLQLKYQDLFYLIENDPQLKEYVEARMKEKQENLNK
jgi:hypothetical protein